MRQNIDRVEMAIQRLEKIVSCSDVQLITENHLKPVLGDDNARLHLFPKNHFNMGAEMYQAHEDITEVIFKEFRKVFMGADNRSLSIAGMFNCQIGTAYYMDYYGTADVPVVLKHVLRHLQEVPAQHRKYGGEIFFLLGFPIDTDMDELSGVLYEELGLERREESTIHELMLHAFKVDITKLSAKL